MLVAIHHASYSSDHEIKIAPKFVGKAIVSDKYFFWKKLTCQGSGVLINFAFANVHAWRDQVNVVPFFTQKSVKYYLLFRVLRN
jgi:hypothetical protein